MESLGWLADDVWLAHGIWFEDDEVARLGRAGVAVSHCPTSNMRLGSGVCRVRQLRAAGCAVGLAVDGSASNDSSNLLAELRQCLLLHRLTGGAAAMTVAEVLEMATLDGARCLGRDDIGRLVPGCCCDLAVFDLQDLGYDGAHDPLAALLLCQPAPARQVVVGGPDHRDAGLVGAVARLGRQRRLDHEHRLLADLDGADRRAPRLAHVARARAGHGDLARLPLLLCQAATAAAAFRTDRSGS